MAKTKWVLLVYKVPTQPTSKRVYVWRKLKRLGAISLQDSIFILPYSEKNLEHLQWLAAEIVEMDGEATVWESYAFGQKQEEKMIQAFKTSVNQQYQAMLPALHQVMAISDLAAREKALKTLVPQYLSIKHYDFFKDELALTIDSLLREAQQKINEIKFGKDSES